MLPVPFHVPLPAGSTTATHYAAASDSGPACVLILAHGAGAGQQSPFLRQSAAGLAARGIDMVTFDFPYMAAGRKAPDRAPVLEETFRDIVVQVTARLGAAALPIFIGGKSMGGRMATHLSATPEAWPVATPLAGVVVFGYPLVPPGRRNANRAAHLQRLSAPTLIVQGTRDNFGGPDALRAATAGAPGITVLDVEGGDHSFRVLKRSGRDQDQVSCEIWDGVAAWMKGVVSRSRGTLLA